MNVLPQSLRTQLIIQKEGNEIMLIPCRPVSSNIKPQEKVIKLNLVCISKPYKILCVFRHFH